MKYRIYTSEDVANFFLSLSREDEGDLISNLKLQKLLYYAYGVFSVVRSNTDAPLFNEKIEAWMHGPVVPSIYHKFKGHLGALPTNPQIDLDQFENRDRSLLESVYYFYGQYSAWKLREMTHNETPWKDVYVDNVRNIQISPTSIYDFFATIVDDEIIQEYQAGV